MFKKVTTTNKRTHNKIQRKIPPHYAVVSAKTVLAQKKIQLLITRIKNLSHISDEYWQALYQPVINNYIEFVQGLPAVKFEAFNKYNGFLELGIRRTIESLVAHRKNHPTKNLKPDEISAQDAVLTYSIFTAAFLRGIGQIPAIYWISLCDHKGLHGHRWNSMQSAMCEQGTYYRYSSESINRDILANYITPLLAKTLLPHDGFVWLSSDKLLFEAWLAFLQNDVERGGLIAEIILPIEEKVLKNPNLESALIATASHDYHYTDHTHEHEANLNENNLDKIDNPKKEQAKLINTNNFTHENGRSHGIAVTANEISGTSGAAEIGILFIEWLKNSIEGVSRRSDRLVHFTQEGAAVFHPEAAKEFLKENPRFGNDPQKVLKSLQENGLAEKHIKKINPQAKASSIGLAGFGQKSVQSKTVFNLDPTLLTTKITQPMSHQKSNLTLNYPVLDQGLKYMPNNK